MSFEVEFTISLQVEECAFFFEAMESDYKRDR